MNKQSKYFKGFSRLDFSERLAHLEKGLYFTKDDLTYLMQTGGRDALEIVNKLSENVIGCFQLPLGIAPHFLIDDEEYIVPMAIEETSVIAAASGTAKWLREHGKLSTKTIGAQAIGQIQLPRINNFAAFKKIMEENKVALIADANAIVVPNLVARGGGVEDLIIRHLPRPDGSNMVVLHVMVNTCNAMGANLTTQVCEFLKGPIQELTQEKVALCILSNLSDTKLTEATVTISNIDLDHAQAIVEAGLFAELDPYRAATHNKGIMNGIDGVLIATGNDWRAVEAGMHAYAARDGRYRPLTQWKLENNQLIGVLQAPISVGIVGGVTSAHPTAKLSVQLLRVKTAERLARIVAAVGLIQNLGALRALTTHGIVKGHMKLHINNLLLAAEATNEEQEILKPLLEDFLDKNKRVTVGDVKNLLLKLRQEKFNN